MLESKIMKIKEKEIILICNYFLSNIDRQDNLTGQLFLPNRKLSKDGDLLLRIGSFIVQIIPSVIKVYYL